MTYRHQKAAIDMAGQRFGRLVVVRQAVSDGAGRARWHCRCDCGGSAVYLRAVLMAGDAKSCGCLRNEQRRAARQSQLARARAARECTLAAVWR